MATKDRDQLKAFFITGATPTQSQFADLIDSAVNLASDGLQTDSTGRLAIGSAPASARLTVEGGFDTPLSGTITIGATAGTPPSAQATGQSTKFRTELSAGNPIRVGGVVFTITAIADDTHMTVTGPAASPVTATAGFRAGPLLAVTDVTGASRVVVDNAGNVGIGTATPAAPLQVAGKVIAAEFQGGGAAIANLNADNIASGTLNASRLTGTLDPATIPAGLVLREGLAVKGHESTATGKKGSIVLENEAPGGGLWSFTAGATGTNTPAGALRISSTSGAALTIGGMGKVEVQSLDVAELNVRSPGKITGNGAGLSGLNAAAVDTGVLTAAHGGTGLVSPGAVGNILQSNGAIWVSSAPAAQSQLNDVIRNSTLLQPNSNFTISGIGAALAFDAGQQYSIAGKRVLAVGPVGSVFIGEAVGGAQSTGIENIFIGYEAGRSNTTGERNTFVGGQTGASSISGSDNTFLGQNSGSVNTTGSFNTFAGVNAGLKNTTGKHNTFIGMDAGINNTTGEGNVAIGNSAAVAAGDLVNAVAIGANSVVSQSNSIVLGSTDTSVGIGTSSPLCPLEVRTTDRGGIEATGYGPTVPRITGRKANGSAAAPTRAAANDVLAEFGARGRAASDYSAGPQGSMSIVAVEDWTDQAHGTRIDFLTTPKGSTQPQAALTINSDGRLTIGGTGKVEAQSLDVADLNVRSPGKITGNGAGLSGLNAAAVDTGVLTAAHGGTGLAAPGAAGNILQSNGAIWVSSAPAAQSQLNDVIRNSTLLQPNSNFTISGIGAALAFDAGQQYKIGGKRLLAVGPQGSVFIGEEAGASDPTGGENTFVGLSAGWHNTTGESNTFVGGQSGDHCISGSYNAFFGQNSGSANTTGSFNTFAGVNAGLKNTTGKRNTCIGMDAGVNITTGEGNLAIGYAAGFAAGDLINAVAIGTNAVVSQSNSIVLGNNVSSVGIGTTSPLCPLEVRTTDRGGIEATGYGPTVPRITGRRANGSAAAPTHAAANDVLAEFGARGRAASDYSAGPQGSMSIVAVEDWTDQAHGTRIDFLTTPKGSTQPQAALTVNPDGSLKVAGTITAAQKLFRIDHPLDPENRYLSHVSVESSEMINIYSGNATTNAAAEAEVRLPDWFGALNTDFRYQLTVIGQFAQAIISKKLANNRFTIRTSLPEVEVSWLITGIRKDAFALANPVRVEERKAVGAARNGGAEEL